IGKQKRPAMRSVGGVVHLGDRRERPAVRGNNLNAAVVIRRDQNSVVQAPTATAAEVGIADGDGLAARNRDPLQLVVGEKSDGAAVGRPEGKSPAFCTWQRLKLERIECTKIKPGRAAFVGGENKIMTVGRNRRGSRGVTG